MANQNPEQAVRQSEVRGKGASASAPPPENEERQEKERSQPGELAHREGRDLASAMDDSPWAMGPFGWMGRMFQNMDRFFDDLGHGTVSMPPRRMGGERSGEQTLWAPRTEVLERDGRLMIRADLPGMNQSDIRVEVIDDTLVIEGERRAERAEERGGLWRSELTYGRFRRATPLPAEINPEDITASFRNGVLEVTVKLPEPQKKSKRVQVKVDAEALPRSDRGGVH